MQLVLNEHQNLPVQRFRTKPVRLFKSGQFRLSHNQITDNSRLLCHSLPNYALLKSPIEGRSQ
jgi:hypothetical protein